MAGTAANFECRDVGLGCAFGDRQVNVKCDNSDPAVQTLSERLSPEWPLFPKAIIRAGEFGLFLMSAFG